MQCYDNYNYMRLVEEGGRNVSGAGESDEIDRDTFLYVSSNILLNVELLQSLSGTINSVLLHLLCT